MYVFAIVAYMKIYFIQKIELENVNCFTPYSIFKDNFVPHAIKIMIMEGRIIKPRK